MLAMEMVIDLHAAEIDEFCTLCAGRGKALEDSLGAFLEEGPALDVHGIGLQRSLPARFGETHRIQDAGRDAVFGSGIDDFTLAGAG